MCDIFKALKKNTTLEKLDLSGDYYICFSQIFIKHFQDNKIGNNALRPLIKSLRINKTLETLDLSGIILYIICFSISIFKTLTIKLEMKE